MLDDFRYALRTLGREPVFAVVVILTLALGIGANTAIFSVVDALLFEPLPYRDADRLYAVTLANDQPQGFQYWPYPKYSALAAEQKIFEATAAYAQTTVSITDPGHPQRVQAEVVTPSYFSLLGVAPARGRAFLESENQAPARDAVVVLGDALWRARFGADPNVVGRPLMLNGRAYGIVGVMPSTFRGQTGTAEIWLPVMMADHFMYKGAASGAFAWWLRVAARLRREVTPEAADAQLPALTARAAAISNAILKTATRDGRELFQLVPFKAIKVDPAVGRSFVVLLAAVAFVLLIACTNTANLLLGRAVVRQKEFAVRLSLGASTRQIVRQVAVESLLLAVAAGAAALLVSRWTLDWLAATKPMNTAGFWSQYARTFDYFDMSLDARVVAFNFGIALVTAFLFGLIPARHAAAVDFNELLKQGTGASAAGLHRLNGRGALVVVEIALSLVLLVSAGLLVRSFIRAASTDLGFEPAGLLTMSVSTLDRKPAAFYRDLLDRVRAIPGVEQAALATGLPLGGGTSRGPMTIEGRSSAAQEIRAAMNVVTPGFFSTLRMRLRAGRFLSDDDRETAPRVAVVNRAFADAAWPGQVPTGRRLKHRFRVAYGDPEAWTTVVGVVDDATYGTLEDPREPMVYLPVWQPLGTPAALSMAPSAIAVRTSVEGPAIVAAVRTVLRTLEPSAPIYDIATMEERAARVTARYRYSSAMMGALAALALVLAAIGVYAVMAYAVAARTREIGIRIALGARPRDVRAVVLGGGLRLTLAGIGIGLAGALAASRFLTSMLYDVGIHDPATFAGISLMMVGVALLASYIPARRAMRVDPVITLKYEG